MQEEKKARSRQFCGARLGHRPGSPRDEKWRGRHGSQLQRATGDRHRARADRECGSDHRRRRSITNWHRLFERCAANAGYATQAGGGRWRLYQSSPRCRRRQTAEWTFMDRGRRVGSPANTMPKAAAGAFSVARFPMMLSTIVYLCPAGKTTHSPCRYQRAKTVCACMSTEHRKQHAVPVPLRDQCGPKNKARRMETVRHSQARILLRPIAFKAKMETEEAKQIYRNDRRSPSSRTPGSKNAVASASFDAAEERRHRWKLPGLSQLQHHPVVQHTTQTQSSPAPV